MHLSRPKSPPASRKSRLAALRANHQRMQRRRQHLDDSATVGRMLGVRLATLGRRSLTTALSKSRVRQLHESSTRVETLRKQRDKSKTRLQTRLRRELQQRQKLVAFSRSVTQVLIDRSKKQAMDEANEMRLSQPTLQRTLPLGPDPYAVYYSTDETETDSEPEVDSPHAPLSPPTLLPPIVADWRATGTRAGDGDDFVVDGNSSTSPTSPSLPTDIAASGELNGRLSRNQHPPPRRASDASLAPPGLQAASDASGSKGSVPSDRLHDGDGLLLGPPPDARPSVGDPPLLVINKDKYGRTVFPTPGDYVPWCPHSRRRDTVSAPLSQVTLEASGLGFDDVDNKSSGGLTPKFARSSTASATKPPQGSVSHSDSQWFQPEVAIEAPAPPSRASLSASKPLLSPMGWRSPSAGSTPQPSEGVFVGLEPLDTQVVDARQDPRPFVLSATRRPSTVDSLMPAASPASSRIGAPPLSPVVSTGGWEFSPQHTAAPRVVTPPPQPALTGSLPRLPAFPPRPTTYHLATASLQPTVASLPPARRSASNFHAACATGGADLPDGTSLGTHSAGSLLLHTPSVASVQSVPPPTGSSDALPVGGPPSLPASLPAKRAEPPKPAPLPFVVTVPSVDALPEGLTVGFTPEAVAVSSDDEVDVGAGAGAGWWHDDPPE